MTFNELQIFCHCLLYATCIKQRATANDVCDLLNLLEHLSLHVQMPQAHEQLVSQHHANLVLLASILSLLPLEGFQDETRLEADKKALVDLARSQKLDSVIRKVSPADNPFMAAIMLVWGVMTLYCDADDLVDRGLKDLEMALDAGAFAFLEHFVLESPSMADETESIKYVASSIVYQLSCLFLEVSQQGFTSLIARSMKGLSKEFDEGQDQAHNTQNDGKFAMDVAIEDDQHSHQSRELHRVKPGPDSVATLLSAIAKALALHPSLFQFDPDEAVTLRNLIGEVGRNSQLSNVPSVLVAYVDVLAALASGEDGARMVFVQLLSKEAPPLVSWQRIFVALSRVVELYTPTGDSGREGQEGYGRKSAPPIPNDAVVLPSPDTKALCAFAKLFARVMSQGTPDEVFSWLRQLDDIAGVSPCWELLFRVMSCPVPQALKAALDRAIAAISCRRDLSIALWDRLVSAVVVHPLPRNHIASSTISQYDIRYQLNEIEARSEDYQEALAFVELLNSLWMQKNQEYRDSGRSLAHFTRFVREDLLGTIFQRSFASEAQRWELVDACFAHCRIVLQRGVVQWPKDVLLAEVQSAITGFEGASPLPPSVEVLFDLLNERSVMRAVLTTVAVGVEELSFARQRNVWGKAQEGALLSALKLLRTGFLKDREVAEMFDASSLLVAKSQNGRDGSAPLVTGIPTIDTVLQHDRSRLLTVIEYVGYPHNDDIQEEALKLTALFAQRTPNIVQLLLSAVQSKFSKSGANISYLQEGFAACFHSALSNMSHYEDHIAVGKRVPTTLDREEDVEEKDNRAGYLLKVFITSLYEHSTPNLAQLLCGFDLSTGMSPFGLVDPRASHTVLREVLDVLEQPDWAIARPDTFERCLELVCALSYAPDTGPAMLHLVQSRRYQSLLPLMTVMGTGSLSYSGNASHSHSRAWLLRLEALEIQSADLAVPSQYESVRLTIRQLFIEFHAREERLDGSMVDGVSSLTAPLIWHILSTAIDDIPQPPQLVSSAIPNNSTEEQEEVFQMLRHLDVEKTLSSGCLYMQGTHGDVIVDVAALKDDLLARYNEWTERNGPPTAALKEACRLALAYAAAFNAYAEAMGGRAALLEAWHSLMVVVFSKRFDVVVELLQDDKGTTDFENGNSSEGELRTTATPTDLLFYSIERTVAALTSLFRSSIATRGAPTTVESPNHALTPALGATLQVLMARAQAHISHVATVDPLGSMPPPMQCHSLLDGLLSLVWDAQKKEEVRGCLYHAVCGYVGISSGPTVLRAPPTIVAAFIIADTKGTPVGEQLDALQFSIEEGSFQVVQKHASRVIPLLASDASSPNPSLALSALACLSSLVTLDLTGSLSDHLHDIGLPGRLLSDVAEASTVNVSNSAHATSELYYNLLDAKLTLLLRITMSGPPTKKTVMAERMFLIHAVDRLARAPVLDGMTPSVGTANVISSIFSQALRLLLLLATALPHSEALKEQLSQFVEAHSRSFVSCLKRVGGDGYGDDSFAMGAGRTENREGGGIMQQGRVAVEQAALVANLLAAVDWESQLSSSAAVNLMEASMRLVFKVFAQNSKSRIPFLMRLETARQDGPPSLAHHQVYLAVITLRVALAEQLSSSILSSPTHLSVLFKDSDQSKSLDSLAILIKDAMVQAVLKDLPEAQRGLSLAMSALQRGSKDAISVRDIAMSVLNFEDLDKFNVENGFRGDIFTMRSQLAKVASLCYTQISKLVAFVEHLLSMISTVFKSPLVGQNGSSLKVSQNTKNEMRRLIEPALASIERLVQNGVEGLSIDTVSLDLLVRRARENLWIKTSSA